MPEPHVIEGMRTRYLVGTIIVALLSVALVCGEHAADANSPSPRPTTTTQNESRTGARGQAATLRPRQKKSGHSAASLTDDVASPRPAIEVAGPTTSTRSEAASLLDSTDRSNLPWSAPGQCILEGAEGDRVAYFSEFVEASEGPETVLSEETRSMTIWTHPQVSPSAISQVRGFMESAMSLADFYVNDLDPPQVYVHQNVEALREHACVAPSALSYYDGAIHVALLDRLDEVKKSVHHEYAHHILSKLGFGRPVWLQEGFAQRFAGESTETKPASATSIQLNDMVEPLSTTSSVHEVAAFYAQASDMLEFLNQLPSSSGKRGYAVLLEESRSALARGTTVPEDLFVWAVIQRGQGINRGDPLALWEHYLKSGGFDDATQSQIEEVRSSRLQ